MAVLDPQSIISIRNRSRRALYPNAYYTSYSKSQHATTHFPPAIHMLILVATSTTSGHAAQSVCKGKSFIIYMVRARVVPPSSAVSDALYGYISFVVPNRRNANKVLVRHDRPNATDSN